MFSKAVCCCVRMNIYGVNDCKGFISLLHSCNKYSLYLDMYKSFPKQQILDSSKLKEFADDNFKFDENGRKFAKPVENTVGKGEISLEITVFSKDLFYRQVKTRACLGKGEKKSY